MAETDDQVLKVLRKSMHMLEELAAREVAKGDKADPKKAAAFMMDASQIGKAIADIEDRRGLVTNPQAVKSIEVELIRSRHAPGVDELEDQLTAEKDENRRLRQQLAQRTAVPGDAVALPHDPMRQLALPAPAAANGSATQQGAAPDPLARRPDEDVTAYTRRRKEAAGDKPQALVVPRDGGGGSYGSALPSGLGWRRFDFPDHLT